MSAHPTISKFCSASSSLLIALCFTYGISAQEVRNSFSDLGRTAWNQGWSSAKGSIRAVKDVPVGENVDSGSSLSLTITFPQGFSYFNCAPVNPGIPGRPRSISVWGKRQGTGSHFLISFGVTGPKVKAGVNYEWYIPLTEEWKLSTFTIPENWPEVTSLGMKAWCKSTREITSTCILNNLQVTTDISGVKDKSSLLKVSALTGRPRNIFLHNEDISYTVGIDSWLGQELKGTLSVSVRDENGATVHREEMAIAMKESISQHLRFKPKAYGIYTVDLQARIDGQKEFTQRSHCAWIPEIAPSTAEEKRSSPWGINIHGATEVGVAYDSIAKLGFTWVRDYAYDYSWLARGRGDGTWDLWPYYLALDEKARKAGLKVLPCMKSSIASAIRREPEPRRNWKSTLLYFMLQFPEYDALEADNEIELRMLKAMQADKFQSYGKYHKHFAEVIHFMNRDAWAVSQGSAGFRSGVVRQMVKEGYFKDIDVVNGHFYTGIYPCLLSEHNANAGQENAPPAHFYDQVREFVAASDCDGKDRQSWVTEFGWDTLAVKIVSEKEQAAYAQRGYALGLIGELDKMFWYWNQDTTKAVPDTFFDGMGIFGPKLQPKPVAPAIAAMIHFLKLPKPVGSFDMGLNSYGHVFEDRGRLVALGFKVDKDKPGPTVNFASGDLHDMYANPLQGRTHALDITPIWIDNIAPEDPLVRATAYELTSKWLALGAGGDDYDVVFAVNNRGEKAIHAEVKTVLPKNWTVTKALETLSVAPGEKKSFTLRTKINPRARESTKYIRLQISEGKVERSLQTQIRVVPPATPGTIALTGAPGTCELKFTLRNNSLSARSFTLKPELPRGWHASPASRELKDVPAKSSKNVSFRVTWTNQYSESSKAMMTILNQDGETIITRGIMPNAGVLPRAGKIIFDGEFSDWPERARMPSWALGRIGTPETVELYSAYAPEGLYFGVKIAPSDVAASQPKTFWSMDCIEVCVDTKNDKVERKGYAKTDHQFWAVPLVEQKRAYLGRWKRSNEIAATQYDIKDVKSFAKRIKDGYAMEFLIPAEAITGYRAGKGNTIGLSINLTSPGRTGTINAYWPLPKSDNVIHKPWLWANVEME